MADNVEITPGNGKVIATDDVGGTNYQRVKLDLGGDGVSVPVVNYLPTRITNTPFSIINGSAAITDEVAVVGGWDGVNVRALKTTSTGAAVIDLAGAIVKVDPEGRSFTTSEVSRENAELALLVSSTRIASTAATPLTLAKQKGLRLYLNVTAAPTTTVETLRVVVSGVDPVSLALFNLSGFATTPAANSGQYTALPKMFVYDLYPSAPVGSTLTNYQSSQIALPKSLSIQVVHSGTNPWTYSVGAALLL